jgi:hypothetical protein
MKASNITLIMIAEAEKFVYPTSVTPNAVPAAGGCSTSITTMINIVTPTDAENHNALNNRKSMKGNTAKQTPTKNPTRCPPIIRFGSAEILFGIVNTMKAVEPMLAITTGLSAKIMVIKNTVATA